MAAIGATQPADTNYIPIDVSPAGYDGIGIRGFYASEALSRIVGYWPLRYAWAKGDALILSLQALESNQAAQIYNLGIQVQEERAARRAEVRGIEAGRVQDRAFFIGYGAGIVGLAVVGALAGGSNLAASAGGAVAGLALGVGISAGVELYRRTPKALK